MTKEEIIEECKQRLGFETDYEMYSLCQHEKDFYNAIIEALEQQPSEDCVSRQAVLDLINADWKYEGLELSVNELPSVTPTQSWIPVSEGLPKKTGWYLVTFKSCIGVVVCEASYRKPENYWTGRDICKKLFDNNEIVAWQPLPKPYTEKRGAENE